MQGKRDFSFYHNRVGKMILKQVGKYKTLAYIEEKHYKGKITYNERIYLHNFVIDNYDLYSFC